MPLQQSWTDVDISSDANPCQSPTARCRLLLTYRFKHGKHFGKHDHHNNGAGGQIDADFGQEKNDFIDSLIDFLEDLCDEPNGCDQSESDFDDIFDDYAEPITLKP